MGGKGKLYTCTGDVAKCMYVKVACLKHGSF